MNKNMKLNKLLWITSSIFISLILPSQEELKLDEEFMASLPPDVQEALAAEIKRRVKQLETI